MNSTTRRTPRGHLHMEAFCLMKYQSDDGLITEWLWNSRDGVTPFCIMARDGKTELMHVEWDRDAYMPDWIPLPGMRIFADLTPEIARPRAMQYVEDYWDHPDYPMSRMFATKEEAVTRFVEEWTKPGSPTVIEVQP